MFKKKFLSLSLMFLLVLFLDLFCTSYTMAYTWSDFIEFLNNSQYKQTNTNVKAAGQYLLNNLSNIETQLQNQNIDVNDYNSFFIYYENGSSNKGTIIAYNKNNTNGFWYVNNNTKLAFASFNTSCKRISIQSNGNLYIDNYTLNNATYDNAWGILSTTPHTDTYGNLILQNYYSYINILQTNQLKISTLPWYIADVQIGTGDSGTDIYLYYNGNQIGELQTFSSTVNGGTLYQVEIINTNGLVNNDTYRINLVKNGQIILSSEDFTLQWQNDLAPSEPSGDTSGDIGGNCDCVPYLVEILGVISGDVVAAIDNNGNVVVGTLGELKEQLQANNQILDDIKDGLFGSGDSGDGILGGTTLESGDEPTLEDLASVTIPDEDDPSHEFFSWLMLNIIDILEDEDEQTLIIPIYKTNYEIRSDVFKLNIEPLKTFIQAGWWFIVGVPFLKYVRRCIEKVKGGEIPASDDKSDLLGNVL